LEPCFSCFFCSCCEEKPQVEKDHQVVVIPKKPTNYTDINEKKVILEKPINDLVFPDLVVPEFLITDGSIKYHKNKYYEIKYKKNGETTTNQLKFNGEKFVYFSFTTEPLIVRNSDLPKNENKLIECGIVIESDIIFEKRMYKFILATMGTFNTKSAILFQFFNNQKDCYEQGLNYGLRVSKIKHSDKTKLPIEYQIPFERIKDSAACKTYETIPEKSESYTESRNGIKFIEKFARECHILISEEFKKSLMESMIHKFYTGDGKDKQLIKFSADSEAYWDEYTETDSRSTSRRASASNLADEMRNK
jgi:hypothetical protein